jgi:hypothetical protein
MSLTKRLAPLFRVGDWVSFQYGPRRVLGQVVEDRGRLGVRGRRLYRIRLDLDPGEKTDFEMREEDLESATGPDAQARGKGGTVAIQRTMSYFGEGNDQHGMPDPWYHYLVVAGPGPRAGSGVASIVSLSEARATGLAQGPSHTLVAPDGGPEAALSRAEEFLDSQHRGLKKIISEKKP